MMRLPSAPLFVNIAEGTPVPRPNGSLALNLGSARQMRTMRWQTAGRCNDVATGYAGGHRAGSCRLAGLAPRAQVGAAAGATQDGAADRLLSIPAGRSDYRWAPQPPGRRRR